MRHSCYAAIFFSLVLQVHVTQQTIALFRIYCCESRLVCLLYDVFLNVRILLLTTLETLLLERWVTCATEVYDMNFVPVHYLKEGRGGRRALRGDIEIYVKLHEVYKVAGGELCHWLTLQDVEVPGFCGTKQHVCERWFPSNCFRELLAWTPIQ